MIKQQMGTASILKILVLFGISLCLLLSWQFKTGLEEQIITRQDDSRGHRRRSSSAQSLSLSSILLDRLDGSAATSGLPPMTPRQISRRTHDDHGVIVFVHVPKTGGTSMWKNMERLLVGQVDYFLSNRHGGWNDIPKLIDQVVLGSGNSLNTPGHAENEQRHWNTELYHHHGGRILWAEIHTNMTSFVSVLPQLVEWRRLAQKNNVPFFAFSIMRDPVDWAVSCFAHVCLRQKRCTSVPDDLLNEEGLLTVVNPNPQCTFYAKGWHEFDRRLAYVPSRQDCSNVFSGFLKALDWVGTMENYDETLLVLGEVLGEPDIVAAFEEKHLMAANDQKPKVVKPKQVSPAVAASSSSTEPEAPSHPRTLKRDELAEPILDYLEQISWLDRALYDAVQETYTRESLFIGAEMSSNNNNASLSS